MRDDRRWLLDVLDAIEKIDRYAQQGRATFDADELVQSWMVQQIQVIGEAVSRLSPATTRAHPDVAWRQIADMRNLIVHAYFNVDPAIVWLAIDQEIPLLRRRIAEIVQALPEE